MNTLITLFIIAALCMDCGYFLQFQSFSGKVLTGAYFIFAWREGKSSLPSDRLIELTVKVENVPLITKIWQIISAHS